MDIPFDAVMVAAAESMAGVAYTDAERALVAAMMDEHLAPQALSTGVVDSWGRVLFEERH